MHHVRHTTDSASKAPSRAFSANSIWSQSQRRVRIWQTLFVRRSLGGLFLLASGIFFALSIGTFWMERVAFTPEIDTDVTYAIMGDEDIRLQVASLIAGADAAELGMSSNNLREFIVSISRIRDGATEMRQFTADAHAKVIGDRDELVIITAAEQVQILRTERAAVLPSITLPVERVGTLAIIGSITSWTWLISFGLGAIALLLGLIVRPERGEFAFAFGAGTAATGASLILFGYLVPAFVLSSTSDDVWVSALPQLAKYRSGPTFIAALVCLVVGAAAILLTGGGRQRRQQSTPLAATRYREQQRWSS
jgi:hypothetical protein